MLGNITERYPFVPAVDNGGDFFVTDSGCYYTVAVSGIQKQFKDNDLLFNGGNLFEISISQKTDLFKEKYDSVVANTIIHILANNIASKGDLATFYYVCEGGGKERLRARKFAAWHKRMLEHLPALKLHDFILPGYEEEFFTYRS